MFALSDIRRSLTAKVLLGLLLLGLLFVSTYATARFLSIRSLVIEREGPRALLLTEPMRFALENLAERHPDLTAQTGRLQLLVEYLARTKGLTSVAVMDASGRRALAASGDPAGLHGAGGDLPQRALSLGRPVTEPTSGGKGLLVAEPLRRPPVGGLPPETFGVLVVQYDLATPIAERQRQTLNDLGVLAFSMLVMLAVVILGLRRFVLEPVSRLAGLAAALGSGDLTARSGVDVPPGAGDEIGRLAQGFDHMAAELEAAAGAQARLHEDLRASEARGRAVFEHASVAISQGDRDGRILAANPAFLRLWGYTLEELKGVRWLDLTHPDDRAESIRQSARLLAGEIDGFALEKRYVRKDGQIVWASVNVASMLDERGDVQMLVLVAEDITARKAAEVAEAEREEIFRAMFEDNRGAQVLLDPDTGRIIDANNAAARFYGYSRDELCGMDIAIINAQPRELILQRIAESKGQGGIFHFTHRLKDGTLREVEVLCGPFNAGGQTLLLSSIQDITEGVRAEQTLKETQERLRSLIDLMDEGVILTKSTGELAFVNPAFARLFGEDAADMEGRPYVELMTPECAVDQPARRAARRLGSREPYVATYLRRDGSQILARVTPFPLFSTEGEYQGSCAIIRDITQARAQEEAAELRRVRRSALLRLHELHNVSRKDLLDFALGQIQALTLSPIGYIYLYDDVCRQFTLHSWSADIMEHCSVEYSPTRYDLDATGVWGDAVRLREPVLLNDYAAPDPRKKGLPEGHVPLTRFLTLPVIRAGRIVAVVGVGNKEQPYDDEDVTQLKLFTDALWSVLERQDALAQLSAVNERFHLAVRAGRIGLWDWDLVSGAMHCDAYMEKSFGLSQRDRTGTPEDWLCRVHQEDRPRVRQGLELARASGGRFEESFRVLGPGNNVLFVDSLAVTYLGPEDRPLRMVGVNIDVTSQRLAEEQVAESQRFLQSVIDTLPNPFACKDADGRYLLVNQAYLWVYGLTPEQVLGHTVDEFLPAALAEEHMVQDKAFLADPSCPPLEYEVAFAPPGETAVRHWLVVKSHLPLSGGRKPGLAAIALDITARTKAEEALRESERRFRTLTQVSPVGIFQSDARGRCTYVNDQWSVISGFPKEAALGLGWLDTLLPKDRKIALKGYRESARTGKDYVAEFRFRSALGASKWMLLHAAPIHTAGGEFSGFVGAITDITETKKAGEALRESERRFRDLAAMLRLMCDNVPDMIWAKDLEKRYLFANKALCEGLLMAHDTAEPEGKSDLFFARRERDSHPDDPNWHTFGELCQDSDELTLRQGGPAQYDEYGNVQGRFLFLDVRKAPFVNDQGETIGIVGSARDITEQKRAEVSLRQSEERFRDLFVDAPLPYQSMDQNGCLLLANDAWLKALGYEREEVVGQSFATFLSPEEIPAFHENFPKFRESGIMTGAEFTMRRKDGSTLLASFNGRVSRDEQGRFVRTHCTFQDITERRKAEQTLRQAKAAAEAATLAKAQFLANMSHEIRTPLGGVIGAAKLLSQSQLSADQRQWAEMAVESGRALLDIVNDILDFSKIEAGRLDLKPAPFALRADLEAVAAPFRMLAGQRGLALNLVVDLNTPDVLVADSGRLDQVLRNLLGNAVKFTETGSITLQVASDPDCPIPHRSACVRFTVRDTGIGIPKDFLPHLFESFRQADGSYGKRHGGTGLGLAISRSLVERMGGQIEVESVEGEGSAFSFTLCLPLASPDDLQAEQEAPQAQTLKPRSLRVLLADDNPIGRTLLERILKDAGHVTTSVGDGLEVLAALEREDFDLVLMDVQMPEVDGVTATRKIRQGEAGAKNAQIPIVALTAYAQAEDRQRFMGAGMDDYVPKPVEERDLLAAMRRALGLRGGGGGAGGSLPGPAHEAVRTQDPGASPRFDRGFLERSFGDRSDLLAEMLEQFQSMSLPEIEGNLHQALAAGNLLKAQRVAHKARGTFGTVGARRASLLALATEKAGEKGEAEDMRKYAEALLAEIAALDEHLRQGRPWPDKDEA